MKSMRSVQGNLEEKLHNAHLQVLCEVAMYVCYVMLQRCCVRLLCMFAT